MKKITLIANLLLILFLFIVPQFIGKSPKTSIEQRIVVELSYLTNDLMTDELNKIVDGIEISKKTNKIIIQNLIFAIGVKILTLLLSLFGIADMWQAVFADVGTTLITIFNTLRILK